MKLTYSSRGCTTRTCPLSTRLMAKVKKVESSRGRCEKTMMWEGAFRRLGRTRIFANKFDVRAQFQFKKFECRSSRMQINTSSLLQNVLSTCGLLQNVLSQEARSRSVRISNVVVPNF